MTGRVASHDRAEAATGSLAIPAAMLQAVIQHLTEALPNEGVGLIGVAAGPGGMRARAFVPGTNIDRSPTRYTMEPAEVVAGLRMFEADGWRLGAIVHSHVATEPTPSETDLREAYYPDALMLIVGFGTGQAEPRLWRVSSQDRAFEAVEIVVVYEPD